MVPLHSYKFISTLQYTLAEYPDSPQRNPLLLRVDHNAGHGGGEHSLHTDMCGGANSYVSVSHGWLALCLSLQSKIM